MPKTFHVFKTYSVIVVLNNMIFVFFKFSVTSPWILNMHLNWTELFSVTWLPSAWQYWPLLNLLLLSFQILYTIIEEETILMFGQNPVEILLGKGSMSGLFRKQMQKILLCIKFSVLYLSIMSKHGEGVSSRYSCKANMETGDFIVGEMAGVTLFPFFSKLSLALDGKGLNWDWQTTPPSPFLEHSYWCQCRFLSFQ